MGIVVPGFHINVNLKLAVGLLADAPVGMVCLVPLPPKLAADR